MTQRIALEERQRARDKDRKRNRNKDIIEYRRKERNEMEGKTQKT